MKPVGTSIGNAGGKTVAAVLLAVACAAGLVRLLTGKLAQFGVLAGALGIGIAVLAVYGLLLALVIRRLDRWRTLHRGPVLAAAGWGGLVAIALAGLANGNVGTLLEHAFGLRTGSALQAPLSAPLVEETLKVLGVLVAVAVARRRLSGPQAAMALGAVSGLGFQLVENVGYLHDAALWNPNSDLEGIASLLPLRLLAGLSGHWLYTAISGLAVGLLLTGYARRGRRAALTVVALLLTPVLLHTANNLLGLLDANVLGLLGLIAVSLLVLWAVQRFAARTQWRAAETVLAAEPVAVCTEDERIDLRTRRTARHARRAVRRSRGRAAARACGRRQRQQIALATAALQGSPTGPARESLPSVTSAAGSDG